MKEDLPNHKGWAPPPCPAPEDRSVKEWAPPPCLGDDKNGETVKGWVPPVLGDFPLTQQDEVNSAPAEQVKNNSSELAEGKPTAVGSRCCKKSLILLMGITCLIPVTGFYSWKFYGKHMYIKMAIAAFEKSITVVRTDQEREQKQISLKKEIGELRHEKEGLEKKFTEMEGRAQEECARLIEQKKKLEQEKEKISRELSA